MLFDQVDFDSDNEIESKTTRRKKKKKLQKQLEEKKKSPIETIVFQDPTKKRKMAKVRCEFP